MRIHCLRCKRLQSCVKSVDSFIPLSTKSAGNVKRDRVNGDANLSAYFDLTLEEFSHGKTTADG